MLNLPESILLGIVQGITEWLPVSSSGHLVLAQKFIGIDVPVAFDIWLHLATLLVIFLFFWQDIKKISNAALKWQTKTAEFKTAIYMITATIATAIVVFPFKNLFERAFSNLPAVAFGFLATGMLLLLSGRRQGNKKTGGIQIFIFDSPARNFRGICIKNSGIGRQRHSSSHHGGRIYCSIFSQPCFPCSIKKDIAKKQIALFCLLLPYYCSTNFNNPFLQNLK